MDVWEQADLQTTLDASLELIKIRYLPEPLKWKIPAQTKKSEAPGSVLVSSAYSKNTLTSSDYP